LQVDRLLGEWGILKDSPAGRQRLEQALEAQRGEATGEEAFRKELLAQMSERLGAEHYGQERLEAAAMERSGSHKPAQRRCGKSGDGGAVGGRDHDDGEVDRGAIRDGRAWSSESPPISDASRLNKVYYQEPPPL